MRGSTSFRHIGRLRAAWESRQVLTPLHMLGPPWQGRTGIGTLTLIPGMERGGTVAKGWPMNVNRRAETFRWKRTYTGLVLSEISEAHEDGPTLHSSAGCPRSRRCGRSMQYPTL